MADFGISGVEPYGLTATDVVSNKEIRQNCNIFRLKGKMNRK
jgi:hypothetical protein